ncbi:MAG: NAD-dependent epimerase/dehydratase family protein [Actinomycetota bacterium]|nr:NAD-dependent epimerase/dehydratase family protein [Actinomycetota bacterium]MDQ3647073.1 NAD-dependent epimerase/dehydratase family protein [Actinomycetota bacterium]
MEGSARTQPRPERLTVAVTGPTGDIGRALMSALERSDRVEKVRGMARREFDPAERGWTKVEYTRGDVLDRDSVEELVAGADVVVHLAFIIFGSHTETREVNLRGSGNVFEAAVEARARRLVYTSSVAAYGFEPGRPHELTEDIEPQGTNSFYYAAQKAELEDAFRRALAGADTEGYVLRPCIVAGEDAPTLIEELSRSFALRGIPPLAALLRAVPGLAPALPDPGVPFQLVHHDDVAAAVRAAVLGEGEPGIYNLAAEGEITMGDLARALGWIRIPIPELAVSGAAEVVSRVPLMPARLEWVHAVRMPSLMRTDRARRELGWEPEHDALQTLRKMVIGAHEQGVVG